MNDAEPWLAIGHVLHIIDAWQSDRINADECLTQIQQAVNCPHLHVLCSYCSGRLLRSEIVHRDGDDVFCDRCWPTHVRDRRRAEAISG